MKRIILPLLLIILSACGPALTPASTSTPTTAPPPTATSTPEATANPRAVTSIELGFGWNPDLLRAFSGAEKTATRETDGSYSVMASTYEGETAVQQKYILDTKSFNANTDIKNAFTRPLEVQATKLDKDGNKIGEVTLLWQGAERGWHEELAPIDSDDSASEQVIFPYFDRVADMDTYLQSARAYFHRHPPFSQKEIDDFMKNSQNNIEFHYDNGQKSAFLLSVTDTDGNGSRETQGKSMKYSGLWVRTQGLDGEEVLAPVVVAVTPFDTGNKTNDKDRMTQENFLMFLDLHNAVKDPDKADKEWLRAYMEQFFEDLIPDIDLYGNKEYQKSQPDLLKLIALNAPGSFDPDKSYLDSLGPAGYEIRGMFGTLPQEDQMNYLKKWGVIIGPKNPEGNPPTTPVFSIYLSNYPLPANYQKMLFLMETRAW